MTQTQKSLFAISLLLLVSTATFVTFSDSPNQNLDLQAATVVLSIENKGPDLCTNIAGFQNRIPSLMVINPDGTCTKPTGNRRVHYNSGTSYIYNIGELKNIVTIPGRVYHSFVGVPDANSIAKKEGVNARGVSIVITDLNRDVCTNIKGMQREIPDKMTSEGNVCTTQTVPVFYNAYIKQAVPIPDATLAYVQITKRSFSSVISQQDAEAKALAAVERYINIVYPKLGFSFSGKKDRVAESFYDLPEEFRNLLTETLVNQALIQVTGSIDPNQQTLKDKILEDLLSFVKRNTLEAEAQTVTPTTATNAVAFDADSYDAIIAKVGKNVCIAEEGIEALANSFTTKFSAEITPIVKKLIYGVTAGGEPSLPFNPIGGSAEWLGRQSYVKLAENGIAWYRDRMTAEGYTKEVYEKTLEYKALQGVLQIAKLNNDPGPQQGEIIPSIPVAAAILGVGEKIAEAIKQQVSTGFSPTVAGVVYSYYIDNDNSGCLDEKEIVDYVFTEPVENTFNEWSYIKLKFLQFVKSKSDADCVCTGRIISFSYDGSSTSYATNNCTGTLAPHPLDSSQFTVRVPVTMVSKLESDIIAKGAYKKIDQVSFPAIITKEESIFTSSSAPFGILWFKYNNTKKQWSYSSISSLDTIEDAKSTATTRGRPDVDALGWIPIEYTQQSCNGYEFVADTCGQTDPLWVTKKFPFNNQNSTTTSTVSPTPTPTPTGTPFPTSTPTPTPTPQTSLRLLRIGHLTAEVCSMFEQ